MKDGHCNALKDDAQEVWNVEKHDSEVELEVLS